MIKRENVTFKGQERAEEILIHFLTLCMYIYKHDRWATQVHQLVWRVG